MSIVIKKSLSKLFPPFCYCFWSISRYYTFFNFTNFFFLWCNFSTIFLIRWITCTSSNLCLNIWFLPTAFPWFSNFLIKILWPTLPARTSKLLRKYIGNCFLYTRKWGNTSCQEIGKIKPFWKSQCSKHGKNRAKCWIFIF